jgi:hypothetical protein
MTAVGSSLMKLLSKDFMLNSTFDFDHVLNFSNLLLTILISVITCTGKWVTEPIEVYHTCVMYALVILSGCIGGN